MVRVSKHLWLKLLSSRYPDLEFIRTDTIRSLLDTHRNQGIINVLLSINGNPFSLFYLWQAERLMAGSEVIHMMVSYRHQWKLVKYSLTFTYLVETLAALPQKYNTIFYAYGVSKIVILYIYVAK